MRQQQQRTGAPAKLPAKCVHSDGKQSFAFAFFRKKADVQSKFSSLTTWWLRVVVPGSLTRSADVEDARNLQQQLRRRQRQQLLLQ